MPALQVYAIIGLLVTYDALVVARILILLRKIVAAIGFEWVHMTVYALFLIVPYATFMPTITASFVRTIVDVLDPCQVNIEHQLLTAYPYACAVTYPHTIIISVKYVRVLLPVGRCAL